MRGKCGRAYRTGKWFLASVHSSVPFQCSFRLQVLVTETALEFGLLVNQLMALASPLTDTTLSAILTDDLLVCRVRDHLVLPQLRPFDKGQETHGTLSHYPLVFFLNVVF